MRDCLRKLVGVVMVSMDERASIAVLEYQLPGDLDPFTISITFDPSSGYVVKAKVNNSMALILAHPNITQILYWQFLQWLWKYV